ncbi:MAG: hypothetical protein GYB68_11690 [Chloroflexi bacterium]|nr:hypothetical protein [Chloroflexota bacterium]
MKRLLILLPLLLVGCAALIGTDNGIVPASPSTTTPPSIPTDVALTPTQLPAVDEPVQVGPSPTPFVPMLTQVTEPGCCVDPFWSPEGDQVRFVDRPNELAATGIYGVGLSGGEPQLIDERITYTSADQRYRLYRIGNQTVVEDTTTATQFNIPSEGRRVYFSPNSQQIIWNVSPAWGGDFDRRPTDIWIANVDGTGSQVLLRVYGGGFTGWLDEQRILISGKANPDEVDRALYAYNISDGSQLELLRQERVRNIRVSPNGDWVALVITFDQQEPELNGLWVFKTDGSSRHKLQVFGAIDWRGPDHLLIIPLEIDAPSHRILQFDARSNDLSEIVSPTQVSFRVAQGDWDVSPTGDHLVFLSAGDEALYVLSLPPLE